MSLWTQMQVCPSNVPVSWHFLQVKCGSSASAGRPLDASRAVRSCFALDSAAAAAVRSLPEAPASAQRTPRTRTSSSA